MLQLLLIQGLLFLWGSAMYGVRSLNKSAIACEATEACSEEKLEGDVRESLSSEFLHHAELLETEVAGPPRFFQTLEAVQAAPAAGPSSGWLMPLRI